MAESTTVRRGDTRERIQQVALARFTENGYDQTSLREIAEDLGVTKAALYYHFKSKGEILDSLLVQVVKQIDALVDWMESGDVTCARRLEMIHRLSEITSGMPGDVMRCVQQNEAALSNLGTTAELVRIAKDRMGEGSLPRDASPEDKLRMRLAITAVLIANKPGSDLGGTRDERAAAALSIAADLVP